MEACGCRVVGMAEYEASSPVKKPHSGPSSSSVRNSDSNTLRDSQMEEKLGMGSRRRASSDAKTNGDVKSRRSVDAPNAEASAEQSTEKVEG